jgi:hypothetical protein
VRRRTRLGNGVRRYQIEREILRTVSALSVALILAICACLQTQGAKTAHSSWQVFAPAHLGFRIEVPSKPHRIENEYRDLDPKGYKSIFVYGPREPARVTTAYEIIVLVPSEAMRTASGGANKLGGMEFTIGGDDAEPASQASINVNGLVGKEFIYHSPDAKTLGHRKGRIIDAKARIFILIYAANTASGLKSSAAARFFNSFRVM